LRHQEILNKPGTDPCELAELVHEKPLAGLYKEKLFGSDLGNTLWVKFSDQYGICEWIGKFGTGAYASARVDKVKEPDRFFILAGGFGYVVDATERTLLNHHCERFAKESVYDAITNRFIVADALRLRVIESGEAVWASPRIGGIRNLKLCGRKIIGLAVTGYGAGYEEKESEFTLDLDTLEVKCPVDFSLWDTLPPSEPGKKQVDGSVGK